MTMNIEGKNSCGPDEGLLDLDDLLETANLSEGKIFEEGFGQGLEEGLKQGRLESWTVGLTQGVNVGLELGDAMGFSEEVANSIASGTLKLMSVQEESRIKKLCEEISDLVKKFPTCNVNEVDLVRLLEDIRAKDNLLRESVTKNLAKKLDGDTHGLKGDGQKYSL